MPKAFVLFALGVVAAWNTAWFFPGVVDDAWISLRYGWNLVHGQGLVFNPGEYAEGYSNPTWTLLGAAWIASGLDPILGLKWTGLVLAALLPAGTFYAARRLQIPSGWALLAAIIPAANLELAAWATAGLETPLWVVVLLAATIALTVRWFDGERRPWSALLLAAVYLTRPEGVLWVGAAVGVEAVLALRDPSRRAEALRWAVTLGIPVLGWLLFRRITYGDWVANTYFVKAAGWESTKYFPSFLMSWAWRSSPVLAGLGLLALSVGWRDRRLWPLFGSIGIQLLFLVRAGTDWMAQNRLWTPMGPLVALWVVGAAATVGKGRLRVPMMVGIGALFVFQGYTHLHYESRYQGTQGRVVSIERNIGRRGVWSRLFGPIQSGVPQRVAKTLLHLPATDRLAHTEIGLLAYVTDNPIHDAFGLVDRRLSGATGEVLREVVEEMPSDWILDKKDIANLTILKKTRWYREGRYAVRARWGPISVVGPGDAPVPMLPLEVALARVEEAVRRVPREALFQRLRLELARALKDDAKERAFCAEFQALLPEAAGDCTAPSGAFGADTDVDAPVTVATVRVEGFGAAESLPPPWQPLPPEFTGLSMAPGEGPGGTSALRVTGEGVACTDWTPAHGDVAVTGKAWVDRIEAKGQGALVMLRFRGVGQGHVETLRAWQRPSPTWKDIDRRVSAVEGEDWRLCVGIRGGEGSVRFAELRAGDAASATGNVGTAPALSAPEAGAAEAGAAEVAAPEAP